MHRALVMHYEQDLGFRYVCQLNCHSLYHTLAHLCIPQSDLVYLDYRTLVHVCLGLRLQADFGQTLVVCCPILLLPPCLSRQDTCSDVVINHLAI